MTLTPLVGILSLSFLTGGLQVKEVAQPPIDKRYGWTEEREVLGGEARQKSQRKTFILRRELMPNTCGSAPATLYERETASGELRPVARNVEDARKAPDGTLFFVQQNRLFKWKDGYQKELLDKSTGDFAFAATGANIALVRLGREGDPTSIALVTSEGKVELELADDREGMLWLPIFTPKGEAIVYLSSESGFASFWRVDLDGTNRRQLTNLNIKSGTGGVFSQDFVPPAERRESMRFVTDTRLEYASGDETWQLDVETGEAWRVRSTETEQEGAAP